MTRAGHALADAIRALCSAARAFDRELTDRARMAATATSAHASRARAASRPVLAVAPPGDLTGDARRACEEFYAAGGRTRVFDGDAINEEVIVDAIFGIGIARPVAGAYARAIAAANGSSRRLLAVDLPSGLDADTGHPHGAAIRADATVSFIGRKLGCYVGAARTTPGCGASTISAPCRRRFDVSAEAGLIGPEIVREALPARARTAHKGRHGHVLVIGGTPGMAGAACLAGVAALRSGAGLVSIATHPASAAAMAAPPEPDDGGDRHGSRSRSTARALQHRRHRTRPGKRRVGNRDARRGAVRRSAARRRCGCTQPARAADFEARRLDSDASPGRSGALARHRVRRRCRRAGSSPRANCSCAMAARWF